MDFAVRLFGRHRKGKPVVRRGRKATDLGVDRHEVAGLPLCCVSAQGEDEG
jgi:hypothetical protein